MSTAATGPEFRYSDLLTTGGSNGAEETPFRLVTTEGVATTEVAGRTVTTVFDLLLAQYGVGREGLPGPWASDCSRPSGTSRTAAEPKRNGVG